MIHQEELFRAAGLPFSNVVMSEAAVPAMLRNAIAVALREKAAVHLALPVDIQSRMLTPPRSEVWQAEVSHLEYQVGRGCACERLAPAPSPRGARPRGHRREPLRRALTESNLVPVIVVHRILLARAGERVARPARGEGARGPTAAHRDRARPPGCD